MTIKIATSPIQEQAINKILIESLDKGEMNAAVKKSYARVLLAGTDAPMVGNDKEDLQKLVEFLRKKLAS